MDHDTCWTLIQGAAGGQAIEREEFARRYLPIVRAYLGARWRTSPMREQMDDAAQEVFVACFRAGGALESVDVTRGTSFRAYLFGVVRNVALHFERRARRRKSSASSASHLGELPADDPTLSVVFDRAFARALMREAAERMAARARVLGAPHERRVKLLRLRFEEGLPVREIARLWDADPTHLHRQFTVAANEFKRCLREVVGLSERCAPDRLEQECERLLDLLA